MGQYYKPIILEDKEMKPKAWMYSHKYDSGLKLMEHSWMKNDFVATFEKQISVDGKYFGSRVVWAGDYADEEDGTKETLYALCGDANQINPKAVKKVDEYPYLVNHTKQEFVDKTKVPDVDGWRIHPLPLLTCEGNGRGGGDFHGESELIGAWARDVISAERVKPEGMKEIIFDLIER